MGMGVCTIFSLNFTILDHNNGNKSLSSHLILLPPVKYKKISDFIGITMAREDTF